MLPALAGINGGEAITKVFERAHLRLAERIGLQQGKSKITDSLAGSPVGKRSGACTWTQVGNAEQESSLVRSSLRSPAISDRAVLESP